MRDPAVDRSVERAGSVLVMESRRECDEDASGNDVCTHDDGPSPARQQPPLRWCCDGGGLHVLILTEPM
jgi:hypothetical protein